MCDESPACHGLGEEEHHDHWIDLPESDNCADDLVVCLCAE